LGAFATQASAFDKIDWNWHKNIWERIHINIKIDADFDPMGMVQVEKLQVFVGDVYASAWIDYIYHDPFVATTTQTKTVTWDSTGTVSGTFKGGFIGGGIIFDEEIEFLKKERIQRCTGYGDYKRCWYEDVLVPKYESDKDPFIVAGVVKGTFDGTTSEWGTKTWTKQVPLALTKNQLPLAEITAVAIGNVESIESEVAVYVNEGQFVFGGIDPSKRYYDYGYYNDNVDDWLGDPNEHTGLVDALLELMADGSLVKSYISANAGTYYSSQTQLDISATAIANAHSIDIDATYSDDQILIADITQFAYADVYASAYLGTTYVGGYNDLGTLTDPLTSVVATAIGNVSTITVGMEP
jgi:hypothetical protein